MLKRMAVAEARFKCSLEEGERSIYAVAPTAPEALRKVETLSTQTWEKMPFFLRKRCWPRGVRLVTDGEREPVYLGGARKRRRARRRR